MIPSRTHEIEAWYALGFVQSQAVVEWALDAITAGWDSASLRILAGLEPPLDNLEVKRLHSAAFAELGIRPLPPEAHVRYYIASLLRRLVKGELRIQDALYRLAAVYTGGGHDYKLVYDFYRLYHAKDSLDSGWDQYYWNGADQSNVDQIIYEQARRWLEEQAEEEEN
jgi:hypothetical protein